MTALTRGRDGRALPFRPAVESAGLIEKGRAESVTIGRDTDSLKWGKLFTEMQETKEAFMFMI